MKPKKVTVSEASRIIRKHFAKRRAKYRREEEARNLSTISNPPMTPHLDIHRAPKTDEELAAHIAALIKAGEEHLGSPMCWPLTAEQQTTALRCLLIRIHSIANSEPWLRKEINEKVSALAALR